MNQELNQLIQECCNRNRQSQSRMYGLLAPKMFVVCQRYTKTREEAEEVLQEGFIKMFEYIHQYKFEGPFEGWVRRIMVNCALQRYRKKTPLHAVVDIDDTGSEYTDTENISAQLSAKELLLLVRQLPPAYQMVFNLYVFEGMKHREIAAMLGISEGTSKSNLSDARTILQKAVIKNAQIASPKTNTI